MKKLTYFASILALSLSMLPGCSIESADVDPTAIPGYEPASPVDEMRPDAPGLPALEIADWLKGDAKKIGDFEFEISRQLAHSIAGPELAELVDGLMVPSALEQPKEKGLPRGMMVRQSLNELEIVRGDVIQEINNVVIGSEDDLNESADNMTDMVVISLARNGEPLTYIYRIR